MKKRLVLLSCALVLLAACNVFQPSAPGATVTPSSSQGLFMQFVPGLPPTTVYDTEQMSVQIQVFNRGGFEVGGPGDRIYLSGFDHNIITGIPPGGQPVPRLDPVDQFNPAGTSDFVTFDDIVIRRIPTERFPVRMLATACYEYQTKASATVCLDPNPNVATLKQKVCNAQTVQLLQQAAPVTVSSVTAEPRRGVTTFRFTVSNAGGGRPFRSGVSALNSCSPYDARGLGFDQVDYVQVVGVTVGGVNVNCRATQEDGHVRLASGIGQFVCEVPVTGNDAYSSPMTVELRYGYRMEAVTQFEVFRTPQ